MRCTGNIWNFAKVVIVDSVFCVTNGFSELRKKGVFGAALIKRRIYWPANIMGDAIDSKFASKGVGNVDSVKRL